MIETLKGYLDEVQASDPSLSGYNTIMNPYAFIDNMGNLVLSDIPFISFQNPVFRVVDRFADSNIGNLSVAFVLANNKDYSDAIGDLITLESVFTTALKKLIEIGFELDEVVVPALSKDLQILQCSLQFNGFCKK